MGGQCGDGGGDDGSGRDGSDNGSSDDGSADDKGDVMMKKIIINCDNVSDINKKTRTGKRRKVGK